MTAGSSIHGSSPENFPTARSSIDKTTVFKSDHIPILAHIDGYRSVLAHTLMYNTDTLTHVDTLSDWTYIHSIGPIFTQATLSNICFLTLLIAINDLIQYDASSCSMWVDFFNSEIQMLRSPAIAYKLLK